jgi:hypothetical protein
LTAPVTLSAIRVLFWVLLAQRKCWGSHPILTCVCRQPHRLMVSSLNQTGQCQ